MGARPQGRLSIFMPQEFITLFFMMNHKKRLLLYFKVKKL
jgi:hypothetical protein